MRPYLVELRPLGEDIRDLLTTPGAVQTKEVMAAADLCCLPERHQLLRAAADRCPGRGGACLLVFDR